MIELRRNRDIYDILESSESTNIIWMTKEDYESLSDDEKNNGLYYGVINNPLREALNPISTPSSILVYTGTAISPNWNYDPLTLEISGDITGTNVGEYTTIFTPKDGYVWSNGSTKPQYVTWKIGLSKVKLINDSDYEYDGKTKTLNIENYIPSLMSVSGTTSASAVGSYSATYSLNEGMFWIDGSTDDITIDWSITKQVANIQYIKTIDNYDIRLYEPSTTIALGTIYCPTSISISYSNSGIVTASISNGMLYVTTSSNFGSTSITLTPQSDDYHDAGPAITIGPLNKNEITATITLDLTNSDPSKWATYSGNYWDQGSDNWDKFFGFYPVVLNSNGTEYKKLSTKSATTVSYSDYYRYFEDGSSTSGICDSSGPATYHTMVCFPRRGIKITINHGVSMEISMTNNPNKSGYSYMAHTYKGASKNKIYIGAHKLYYTSGKLYNGYSGSFAYSGSYSPSTMRSYVQAKGTGFELMGWYQNTYILVMYTLKYKAANSTNYFSISGGNTNIHLNSSTVSSNTLDYNSYGQIFGLAGFTGTNCYGEYIEGAYAYNRYLKICTNNNYANSANSNYTNTAYFSSNVNSTYAFKEPIGDNSGGFYPDPSYYSGGSNSTYFCTGTMYYYSSSITSSYCLCRGYYSDTLSNNFSSIYCISTSYLTATTADYQMTYRMMYYG